MSATSDSGQKVTFSVDPTSNTLGKACSISGSSVTFKHAGTCVITAAVPSKTAARGAAAKDYTQVVNIAPEDQADLLLDHPPARPWAARTS